MRRLLAVLALVPTLALTACGSGGGTTAARTPLEIVRLAGASTAEAGSAKMAMSMDAAGLSMTADGVTSLEETKGSMTMNMTIGGQALQMEMRLLGQVIYIKMPPGANPGGKPWAKLDIEELSQRAGFDISSLQQFKNADPTSSLAYFEGVSDDVKEVGKEDVRGEATTKYTATFDLDKAIANHDDADAKDALRAVTKQLGLTKLPATIWIDDDGRMRKMVQSLDLSKVAGAQGGAGQMTITFELYEFGTKVDVEAPPADQVGDGAALLGG